jgi:Flp pilus assembly protein TadG
MRGRPPGPRARSVARPGRHVSRERGAALVELVLIAVPLLLMVLVVLAACGRLFSARAALGGVTRDAARVAATAADGGEAVRLGTEQARRSATGYAMDEGRLEVSVDPGPFQRGGTVRVKATYRVRLLDLPGLGPAEPSLLVSDQQVELIDPYRSR